MSKPFYCWLCKYFRPDDPATLRSGRCHRFAPHSLDYYGFSGIEVDTPLTTKGDIYTFSTEDARLPVGADGEIIYADSTQATGQRWGAPPTGVEILTTKGDILTHNGSAPVRMAVGSDGQHLVADSSEANGVKWADAPPLPYIAHAMDDTESSTTSSDWQQKLRCTFTATSGVRYKIEWYYEQNAYMEEDIDSQVTINDSTVICEGHFKNFSPYTELWEENVGGHYITDSLSGTVNIDIDWKSGYGSNTKKIRRARILITRVDDATTAPLAMAAAMGAETLAGAVESGVVLLSLPASVPAPTSVGKYSQIYDGGPGMWCGQFRPNTKDIPPLP